MPTELELDSLFWNAISTNKDFQTALLDCTKYKGKKMTLLTGEPWHQRWYKNPDTKIDSETDITLTFKDDETGDLHAIHIENKPPHRTWEKLQAESYRLRAENRMKKWKHQGWTVGLIATKKYLHACPEKLTFFDFSMTYEEIGKFVPEFEKLCCLSA